MKKEQVFKSKVTLNNNALAEYVCEITSCNAPNEVIEDWLRPSVIRFLLNNQGKTIDVIYTNDLAYDEFSCYYRIKGKQDIMIFESMI